VARWARIRSTNLLHAHEKIRGMGSTLLSSTMSRQLRAVCYAQFKKVKLGHGRAKPWKKKAKGAGCKQEGLLV